MAAVAALILGETAIADDLPRIEVTIRDHRFWPSDIHVPAGQPTVLVISNADPAAEEFDSLALRVEKVVPAGGSATIRLRPLAPGRYPFAGEFHADTAKGVVISD